MSNYDNPNDPNRLTPSDPEVRRSDVGRNDLTYNRSTTTSFWPWIVGLLVLLAIGWIVIEAFDQDTDTYDGAVPAAGEMEERETDIGRSDTNYDGTPNTSDDINRQRSPAPLAE